MAFWGIELKPGNPYRHRYEDARGRLHVSQATLGSGQSSKKSVSVQCNVGDKSPVLLCSLLPEKNESCPLNLEFEEDDEVVFSVIGSRSVHLTGFYLGPSSDFDRHGDDSDSYGEDIAETETDQSSDYDSEDEYEDDFIDDDLEMFPSPRPNSGEAIGFDPVTIEEIVDDDKPANGTGSTKRLKKKHELSESDSGDDSQQKNVVRSTRIPVLESEDEDGFPVSTTLKSKCPVKNADKDKSDKVTTEDGLEEKTKDDGSQGACLKRKIVTITDDECDRGASQLSDSFTPSDDVAAENGGKSKKKKKETNKNRKYLQTEESAGEEATNGCKSDVLNKVTAGVGEEKIVNKDQDSRVSDELKEKLSNDKEVTDSRVPSDTIVPENSGKLKKKKKSKAKDKTLQTEVGPSAETEVKASSDNDSKPRNSEEAMIDAIDQDPSIKDQELNGKLLDENSLDRNVDPAGADNQNESKKKKKKKKNKTHQGDTNASAEESGLMMEEAKNEPIEKINEQKAQARSSKVRTFSNGLAIEELSMGKPDGKRAYPGNKVSVHYIGKLKQNGEIFDSNIGRRPFKFRLGIGQVIKGWDVGVAGMRIGDKRRLTIPPSMGYGDKGAGKIPGNAWLLFDVELVDVQ